MIQKSQFLKMRNCFGFLQIGSHMYIADYLSRSYMICMNALWWVLKWEGKKVSLSLAAKLFRFPEKLKAIENHCKIYNNIHIHI